MRKKQKKNEEKAKKNEEEAQKNATKAQEETVKAEKKAQEKADQAAVAAEKEAQRQNNILIASILAILALLIIIVIIIVVLSQKKLKKLKDERAEDEKLRENLSNDAENVDIELTLDEQDEMDYNDLDDLTSQLRSVNMKLKKEVARLTELNIALASTAGVAPLSIVVSDDAGTLVNQIRELKNANDQLRSDNENETSERKHKKKKEKTVF